MTAPTYAGPATALVTMACTAAALTLLLPYLKRRAMVDIPNDRSSHSVPTPRGGGLGLALGIAIGIFTGSIILANEPDQQRGLAIFAGVALTLAALGWVEDSKGLSVPTRLGCQLSTALVGVTILVGYGVLSWVSAALLAGLAVFQVNTTNFMDGINGLSGLMAITIGAYFLVLGVSNQGTGLSTAALATCASFLAFLPWNTPNARLFLGDSGSYLLGGAIWGLTTLAIAADLPVILCLAPFTIYATDVLFTLVTRAARGEHVTSPHRDHIYQQIQQLTGSHFAAAAIVIVATIACVSLSLGAYFGNWRNQIALAGLLLLIAVLYLRIPSLLGAILRAHRLIRPTAEISKRKASM